MATTSKHNHKLVWSVIGILAILVILASFKFFVLKKHWDTYTTATQKVVMEYPKLDSQEDAALIATTISTVPSSANPLLHQTQPLRSYISTIGKQMNRDIVVVDTKKMILADTVSANYGSTYSEDKGNEVGLTLKDGIARAFTETSHDYPQGVEEGVVAIRNSQDQIVGAVILSRSSIFSK